MNRDGDLLRGRGVAQQIVLPYKPYQWGGRAGWSPAALGPMPTRTQEREARYAEFARLREECGLGVRAAAVALGLPAASGWHLERQRKAGGT